MDFLKQFLEALLGGSIAGGILGAIGALLVKTWLHRIVSESRELKRDLEDLKDNRINKIEKAVTEHIASDSSREVMTELRHINGTLNKVSDKVDCIMSETASQQAQIDANAHYIKNIDNSLQRHKESHHAK